MSASTTPLITDPARRLWERILTKIQQRSGALAKNNPKSTDTMRQLRVKVDNALNGR